MEKKRDKGEFLKLQKTLVDEGSWVIEGRTFSTFEIRFARAEVVIYFFLPRYICYWRMVKRLFNLRKITWELLKYTWNFDKLREKLLLEKIERIVFQLKALELSEITRIPLAPASIIIEYMR